MSPASRLSAIGWELESSPSPISRDIPSLLFPAVPQQSPFFPFSEAANPALYAAFKAKALSLAEPLFFGNPGH